MANLNKLDKLFFVEKGLLTPHKVGIISETLFGLFIQFTPDPDLATAIFYKGLP